MPDDTAPSDTVPPSGPAPITEPVGQPGVPAPDEVLLAMLAGGEVADGDAAWPAKAHRSGVRLRVPLLVLLALVVAAGAFWGGAAVQRADGTTSTGAGTSGFAARIAALLGRSRSSAAGSGGSSAVTGRGAAGLGGFSAPAASGTLTAVVGSTLYLTSSSGAIVKVKLPPSATVDLNATASAAELKSGDTVVVEGTTSKSGVVTATSVSASAPGVAIGGRGALAGAGAAGGFGGAGAGGSGG